MALWALSLEYLTGCDFKEQISIVQYVDVIAEVERFKTTRNKKIYIFLQENIV